MEPPKTLDEDDVDAEPDQSLADLPPSGRSEGSGAAIPASVQPTPSAVSSEPQERRAQVGPALPRDDVVKHLPPKLLETLVDVVRTLDQLSDGVAGFRPDQLGFLSDKAQRYVELLQQADKVAADYSADIPLQVLKMMDEEEESNPELFTKAQLEKCQDESEQAATKAETLEMLTDALHSGLEELE